ncbi:MAG: hypothetical protein HYR49_10860 [Gammaproteobacteria bacterium]|nr:hypothetical protein [Gammaproteobacteria bacterium]
MLLEGGYEGGAVFLAFGAGAAAIGGGGIVGGIRWVRRSRRFFAQQAAHPDEPWLWREDWHRRRIADDGLFWMAFFWMCAIVWNAISLPVAAYILAQGWLGETGMWLYAFGFPAAGFCLIWAAFYFGRRFVKFGRAWFLPDSLPYRLGGPLEGKIEVERGRYLTFPVTVGIANRHVRNVPKVFEPRETNIKVDVLWEGTPVTVDPGDFTRANRSVIIPVRLTLPVGGLGTDIRSGTNKVDWVLRARSDVPGVDFDAEFEIPIF